MKKAQAFPLLLVAMLLISSNAVAQIEAYGYDSETIYCMWWAYGTSAAYGQNNGWAFRTEQSIEIMKLGVFDSQNQDVDSYFGLWVPTHVGIFSFPDGELLREVVFPAGHPGECIGEYRYLDIEPITLPAGTEYMMVRYQTTGSVSEQTFDTWPDMQITFWWDGYDQFDARELLSDGITLLPGQWYDNYSQGLSFPTWDGGGEPTGMMGAVNFWFTEGSVATVSKSLSQVRSLFQ